MTQQWSLTVEQQLRDNWMLRASYVGAQTRRALYTREDINRPDVQRPNTPLQAQRPYQPWGEIGNTHTNGKVNFNQLQLELKKRLSVGLLVEAQYSFTRSLDDVPVVGGTESEQPPCRVRELRIGSAANVCAELFVRPSGGQRPQI